MKSSCDLIAETIRIELAEVDPCLARAEVFIPPSTVEAVLLEATAEVAREARLPGFRPGRAPASVVSKACGEAIAGRALKTLYSEAINRVMSSIPGRECMDYRVIDESRVAAVPGQPFAFTVEVDLVPLFTLPPYKGLTLAVPDLAFPEDAVEENVEAMRAAHSRFAPCPGPAMEGDMLRVSYSSDAALPDDAPDYDRRQANAEDNFLWVADSESIPGVKAALEGAMPGDTRVHAARYPDDAHVESLRGKTVTYSITVKEVHRKRPMTDEELCARLGAKSMEAVREGVRKNIEAELKRANRSVRENAIVDKIMEGLDFPLPKAMLESAARKEEQRMSEARASGDKRFPSAPDALRDEAVRVASRNLRATFVLREIARQEKLQVDMEDVASRVMAMSRAYGIREKDLTKRLVRSGAISRVYDDAVVSKVVQHLVAVNTFEPAPVDPSPAADRPR